MIGRVLFFVLLLPLLAALSLPQMAAAACSALQGRAAINEVYRGPTYFLEVKLLDPTLDITGWNVRVCTQDLGCTADIPLSSATRRGPYLIFEMSPLTRDRLDFSKRPLDILLTDSQGNAVDYLNFNNHSVQAGTCGSYPYATTLGGSTNSFSIAREPDGNGPFVFGGSGNSVPDTPGEPNDDDPDNPLPRLDGSNATVARGTPAVFTITLSQAAAGGETVSYQTVDDTAEAGTHYQAAAGTVTFPAGANSVTVTVDTIAASPPPDGIYFWLNLMNPTGASLNTHFLQGSLVGGLLEVNHYRLQHAGDALTCQRAEVTLLPCLDAGCTSLYTGGVTATLTPSGWVGGDTQSFSGGAAILKLRRTTPGAVTLGISSASPPAVNPLQCSGGPAGAPCALTFHDSGFIFDVPNLNSCQDSGDVTIQAVRKSDASQACVADGGFAGTTRDISFSTTYLTPGSGTSNLTLNGITLPGVVTLSFDVSARSNLNVHYADAGQLQVSASFAGSGEEAGLVMTGSDTFIARPDHFSLLVTGGGVPLNNLGSSGDPKWKGGEDFRVQVEAVCADGSTVTPNFAADVTLTSELPIAPVGGTKAPLLNGDLSAADFSGGIASRNDVSYGEVGNFTLQARTADYLGTGPVTGSVLVGRFTPHHFDTSLSVPEFGAACAAGGFTYIGQPFHYTSPPVITVTAKNLQNGTTANYAGGWWKITNATLSGITYTAAAGTLDTSAAPPVDPVIADNGGGSGTLTFSSGDPASGGFTFTRAAPQAPFDAEISLSIDVADSDGITPPVNPVPPPLVNPVQFGGATPGNGIGFDSSKLMRYGRLNLLNAYGPEILPLAVPLRAEYYIDAANGWGINALDACTPYATGDLALGPWIGTPGGSTAVVAGGPWSLVNGAGNLLTLIPPGSGKEGSVNLTLTVPGWLKVDRDGDGVLQEDPQARATFGIYKGNPRLIHIRAIP